MSQRLDAVGPDASLVQTRQVAHMDFVELAAKIGFWDYDSSCGLVHWSYGMEVLYGLQRGGFQGTPEAYFLHLHPDDAARNLQETQAFFESSKPFEHSFRIVRVDGVVRWMVSRGAAHFDAQGSFMGASGMHADITEQVEREQHMRLQTQVLTSMVEGVVLVGADSGTILYANPGMEQMLGYGAGQLQGLHIAAINARSDSDPAATAHSVMAALDRHGLWAGELKNRCANGHEIWTHANVSELHFEGLGKIWVAVHSNIDERRLAQDAREAAFAELRRLSLNIQESLEAERLAVSRDVHDQLGAALTGMRMRLEALAARKQGGGRVSPAELLAVAATARDTQLAAREICTRLRPQMLDDLGLLEACRWYARDWSATVGIVLTSRFSRLPAEPDGNRATHMFRVLQELLTNVARHAAASQVRVSLSGGAQGLLLRVQDNGQGFATQQATAGFGLMGMRERVRQLGGVFQLESGASGTRISVRIPQGAAP